MKKGLLSLSLVLMVATMGVGCGEAQFSAPQPLPPVNQPASSNTPAAPVQPATPAKEMVTFKNDKYGFQFTYDKSAIGNFNEKDFQLFDSSPARIHESQQNVKFTLGDSATVEINVYNNEGGFGQDVFVTDVAAQDYKEVTINGKKAEQGSSDATGNEVTNTVFYGDKYLYEIKLTDKNKDQKNSDAYNAIIQSFEFSSSSTGTPTSTSTSSKEAVLYENSKYGFRLVTTNECQKQFSIKEATSNLGKEMAKQGYVSFLEVFVPLSKQWPANSVWYYYSVISNANYTKLEDSVGSPKPSIVLQLNNFVVAKHSPQDGPLDLPKGCAIKTVKI